MKRIFTIVLLSLAALAASAQVYVATDKSCYLAGERIWCSVFCAEGPSVAYLELISADGPAARARIDVRKGRGGGSLLIPLGTPTGNYRLFAYSGPSDVDFGGPVLSIFNTLSGDRVTDGVEIVEEAEYGKAADVQTGYGISVQTAGGIVLENTSGRPVSCSVSLRRNDSVREPGYRSIATFAPGAPSPETFGERLTARVVGPDASKVISQEIAALIAFPGSKTDCYSAYPDKNGLASFETENVFGDRDVVCVLEGLDPGLDCHLEMVSPFLSPKAADLPKLKLCRSMEDDLVRRSAAMLDERASDTLATTLPMRREHFMLANECISYILDDYTRFPTMEEVFVEITPTVKLRRPGKKTVIYALMNRSVVDGPSRWGEAVVMIDGVPVPDQKLIETYDPAIVKVVEVYPYRYNMGYRVFDGVVNLVTIKGNMPGVLFDDNVRIYDFQGCSWPMAHEGSETPFWNPLVTLKPGEKMEIPASRLQSGVEYTVTVEGLADGGRPVYLRKSFVR